MKKIIDFVFFVFQSQKALPTNNNNKESKEDAGPEMLIKHPLQHSWTLWFFKNENNRSWEESQMEIASFNTVEDFWA